MLKYKDNLKSFLDTDYKNDLPGMCMALVKWIQDLNESGFLNLENLPPAPSNYVKNIPHIIIYDKRDSVRKMINHMFLEDQMIGVNEEIFVKNIFIAILATMYTYHFPVQECINAAKTSLEFNRKDSEKVLLSAGMSPNWL